MNYPLHDLSPSVFEELVNTICQDILGTGVITFTSGKDGGSDGEFYGTSEKYPSSKDPWKGKFVIQAKHTTSPVASCSDYDFEKLVDKEIVKIKKLNQADPVNNYLLFTNRKYSAIKGKSLTKKISDISGIENVAIIGKEVINNQFLSGNKKIVSQYNLHRNHIPFEFSEREIKEIILAFKNQLPKFQNSIKSKSDELKYDFSHIEKDEKNKKNNLSRDYYEHNILGSSLMQFDKIEEFLKNPVNEELKEYYYDTANELNELISIKRDNFDAFEELFHHIYQLITNGPSTFTGGGKRHITAFLHYMYVECLIGKK